MDLTRYITAREAAAQLGCTPRNIGLLRQAGYLPGSVQIGPRSVLIPRKSVANYARREKKSGRPRKYSA